MGDPSSRLSRVHIARSGANTRPSSARLVSGLGRDLADLAQQLLYELAALRIVDLEGWM